MSTWPDSSDYKAAIKDPSLCFHDPDLQQADLEIDPIRKEPKVWAGDSAQVYLLKSSNGRWAIKCFTRAAVDIRERYLAIAETLAAIDLPYLVNFHFLDNGIIIDGLTYPIVKIEWVDGTPLNKYIEDNLNSPAKLLTLSHQFIELITNLEAHGIAHGDLQHGNILIQNDQIKLIDYDGIFIPAFKGRLSTECGLSSFQHPQRSNNNYDAKLDRFSLLVICTALFALSQDASLWQQFNNGENMLLCKEDFEDPYISQTINKIQDISNELIRYCLDKLVIACNSSCREIPLFSLSEYSAKYLKKEQSRIETELLQIINVNENRSVVEKKNIELINNNISVRPALKVDYYEKYPPGTPVGRILFRGMDGCYLTVIEGVDFGRVFLLEKSEAVLGRSDEADFQIDDEKVSRKHLKIFLPLDGIWQKYVIISDLNSKNGVFVNGQQVYKQELRDGDYLKVGNTILKFEIKERLDSFYRAQLYREAISDPLTGLSNRNHFQSELRKFISIASRYNRAFSVLIIDIDLLRKINSSYGHDVGDNVLKAVADILKMHVRNHDIAARFAGKRFVMLLPEINLEDAAIVAEKIRSMIESYKFEPMGCKQSVTVSIGIGDYPAAGQEGEEIVNNTEIALKNAKNRGRNRVCIYQSTASTAQAE